MRVGRIDGRPRRQPQRLVDRQAGGLEKTGPCNARSFPDTLGVVTAIIGSEDLACQLSARGERKTAVVAHDSREGAPPRRAREGRCLWVSGKNSVSQPGELTPGSGEPGRDIPPLWKPRPPSPPRFVADLSVRKSTREQDGVLWKEDMEEEKNPSSQYPDMVLLLSKGLP